MFVRVISRWRMVRVAAVASLTAAGLLSATTALISAGAGEPGSGLSGRLLEADGEAGREQHSEGQLQPPGLRERRY